MKDKIKLPAKDLRQNSELYPARIDIS